MNRVEAKDLFSFLLSILEGPLAILGLDPKDVPDDLDLLTEGVVDSMGMIELITAIEKHFAIQIDFENLDPEEFTVLGPFCRYIEQQCNGAGDQTT